MHPGACAVVHAAPNLAGNSSLFFLPSFPSAMARSVLHAVLSHSRRTHGLGTRNISSDGYFGFDSVRSGRSAVRIDGQSTAGRPDGHLRTANGVRDRMPSDEGEKANHGFDLDSAAQGGTGRGVEARRSHR